MLLKYSAGIDEMQRMVWLYQQYMQTDPTIKYWHKSFIITLDNG